MNIGDGHARGRVAFHAHTRDLLCFVRRIVKYLNVEELPRIVKARHSFCESFNYVSFIEDRQLHRDARPARHRRRRRRDIFGILEIVVDQPVAVQAVHRQHHKHDKVGNEHCQVEGIDAVNAAERPVAEPMKVTADRALVREKNRECEGGVHDKDPVQLSSRCFAVSDEA